MRAQQHYDFARGAPYAVLESWNAFLRISNDGAALHAKTQLLAGYSEMNIVIRLAGKPRP